MNLTNKFTGRVRPTNTELDRAIANLPLRSDGIKCSYVPNGTCSTCGCPTYIPSRLWQSGWLSPIWLWTCKHGPSDPRWLVNWYELTLEQRADLMKASAVAAIQVKNWSRPSAKGE